VKILLDTSVLIAAMVEAHPAHDRALPWLKRVNRGPDHGFVAAHSLAEVYSILTTLPVQPKISPNDAHQLIQ
jgi:predicted nucleic acid-binding protein